MPQIPKVPNIRGRKTKQASRAAEFRQRLLIWRQTPEGLRPSLRALARQLGTSHQLLSHFLADLDTWHCEERRRMAERRSDGIRARAEAENRALTLHEEEQIHICTLEALRAKARSALLKAIEEIRQDAEDGPVHPAQFKTAKLFAKHGLPRAQELLQECLEVGVKKRKRFREIVKAIPRLDGETPVSWFRRIWAECDKYDTNCPTVVSIEMLERYSKDRGTRRKI